MKYSKTVSPKVFDWVITPLTGIMILLGVETTCGYRDGKERIYNAKGEKRKWIKRKGKKMTDCDHENWEIQMDNMRGYGHCNDCHKQITLALLFNNLRKRMENVISQYTKSEEKSADRIEIDSLLDSILLQSVSPDKNIRVNNIKRRTGQIKEILDKE